MNNTPWKLGVPQTVDGEEYVVVRIINAHVAIGIMRNVQRPVVRRVRRSSCNGCPIVACGGPLPDSPCGAGKSGNRWQRIVPLKLVPTLALEGVLE